MADQASLQLSTSIWYVSIVLHIDICQYSWAEIANLLASEMETCWRPQCGSIWSRNWRDDGLNVAPPWNRKWRGGSNSLNVVRSQEMKRCWRHPRLGPSFVKELEWWRQAHRSGLLLSTFGTCVYVCVFCYCMLGRIFFWQLSGHSDFGITLCKELLPDYYHFRCIPENITRTPGSPWLVLPICNPKRKRKQRRQKRGCRASMVKGTEYFPLQR